MSNLIRNKTELLFNSLSVHDFGVYASARTKKDIFSIKPYGIQIPGIVSGTSPSVLPSHIKAVKVSPNNGAYKESIFLLNAAESHPSGNSFSKPALDMFALNIKTKPPRKGGSNEYMETNVYLSKNFPYDANKTAAQKLQDRCDAASDFVLQNAVRGANPEPDFFNGKGRFFDGSVALAFAKDAADINVSIDGAASVNIVGADYAAFKTDIVAKGLTWKEVGNYVYVLGVANKSLTIDVATSTDPVGVGMYAKATSQMFPFQGNFDILYVGEEVITKSKFPTLSPTEVARIFSLKADMAGTQPPNIPVKGATYYKYRIEFKSEHYGLDSASGYNQAGKVIEIYVKSDLIATNIWNNADYNDESGSTADANFEQLLTRAFGIAPNDWK